MQRRVIVPTVQAMRYMPPDFRADARRILSLMADDWETVECEPVIHFRPGRDPEYDAPKWTFKSEGSELSAVVPMQAMHDAVTNDPHVYALRLGAFGMALVSSMPDPQPVRGKELTMAAGRWRDRIGGEQR